MINVLFVCHGNICRSPMAEYLFKNYVKEMNKEKQFHIESMATSTEEIGNRIHFGARKILDKYNIDSSNHRARQIKKSDYDRFDYIIVMDSNNLYNIQRIVGIDKDKKIHLFLDYAGMHRDISDPWYTGDFDKTEDDIIIGIKAFYNYLFVNKKIL
ncbi:MAG: low molecular weight phosphotyrosine protein phosphatase [Acholeplasmatales bacterium]|nr:low molecular weight phosphotyrosine protein phosphatase [Acholeplasmatales bacterium]